MARTKSESKSFVEARLDIEYFMFEIGRNGGQYVTPQQLGSLLYKYEAEMMKAGREAMYAIVRDSVNRMAGILPREISDNSTQAVTEVAKTEAKKAGK